MMLADLAPAGIKREYSDRLIVEEFLKSKRFAESQEPLTRKYLSLTWPSGTLR